ncbi:tetratricopeptide repeat-containing sulfotransferase family protein [Shewanella psychrotolerans]|uniref:tetratricopeptide repeat-containing sulfotransferase family protein n=1 Tax=Shewanella psychrotolerans TaxID=2864206 RepID=UPI001C65C0CD|nr:sulfotransferase [Shewanella psychrotolerans]QYJ99771.1 sulfotransferase [Shewanella psychrotolerans]
MSSIEQAEQHIAQGEYYLAQQIFTALTHNRPTSKETGYAYMGLGKLALLSKNGHKAVELLSQSCEFLAGDTTPLSLLAEAFNMVNAAEDALTVLNYANQIVPESPTLRYQLGRQQIAMGELEQAKAHLLLALSGLGLTDNAHPCELSIEEVSIYSQCLLSLSQLVIHADPVANLNMNVGDNTSTKAVNRLLEKALRLNQLCDNINTNIDANINNDAVTLNSARIVLHYCLGHLFHHRQAHRLAFDHYQQANNLQHQGCCVSTSELAAYFHSIKTFVNKGAISVHSDRHFDITPIFILGLPRTGASILEQLLVKHNQIGSAGECDYLNDDVLSSAYKLTAKHYPRCISDLDVQQLNTLGELYLRKLKQYVNPEFDTKAIRGDSRVFHPDITHIIDRSPANFQTVGLIYKLFPNAKVINLTRQPEAVSWSVYQHYFEKSEPHLCSLKEFELYRQEYEALMAYWHQTLPGFVLDVSYEALVDLPESQISRVLAFCRLPFGDTQVKQMKEIISAFNMVKDVSWQDYLGFVNGNA